MTITLAAIAKVIPPSNISINTKGATTIVSECHIENVIIRLEASVAYSEKSGFYTNFELCVRKGNKKFERTSIPLSDINQALTANADFLHQSIAKNHVWFSEKANAVFCLIEQQQLIIDLAKTKVGSKPSKSKIF